MSLIDIVSRVFLHYVLGLHGGDLVLVDWILFQLDGCYRHLIDIVGLGLKSNRFHSLLLQLFFGLLNGGGDINEELLLLQVLDGNKDGLGHRSNYYQIMLKIIFEAREKLHYRCC